MSFEKQEDKSVSGLKARHWTYVNVDGPEPARSRHYRWDPLEHFIGISERCSTGRGCLGWIYKLSDGRWFGVTGNPRTMRFYPTEDAAIMAIMLQSKPGEDTE